MSRTFTKLFTGILESTVWCEPLATRIVWITMLAMADRRGRVWASVPGLANRAQVSLQDAKAALDRFLAPDPYSRTPDHGGRRIEVIDGGWILLNYIKYREMRDHEERLEYQRRWDREHRLNPTLSDKTRPRPTNAEAEAEEENLNPLSGEKPPDDAPTGKSAPKAKARQQARASATRAIEYLNSKAGTRFRAVEANLKLPAARILQDGATEEDLRAVVDFKVAEAERGEFDRRYLRPATLWNAEKFSQYIGLVNARAPAGTAPGPMQARVALLAADGKVVRELDQQPAGDMEAIARKAARDYAGMIAHLAPRYVAVRQGTERRQFSVEELRA